MRLSQEAGAARHRYFQYQGKVKEYTSLWVLVPEPVRTEVMYGESAEHQYPLEHEVYQRLARYQNQAIEEWNFTKDLEADLMEAS